MLNVKTPAEVKNIIKNHFPVIIGESDLIGVPDSSGRVLCCDIVSEEDIPGFDRSTVDGYAVKASDTFGCSESMPVVLDLCGEILMGYQPETELKPGTCAAVSTGGALPENADAVVMLENTENYGNNMIGISKPAAPGNNLIFKGDDVKNGQTVLSAGTNITPHDTGILSALGYVEIEVRRKPKVGIISTGDELVKPSETPKIGQVRNINSVMLTTVVMKYNALPIDYGIIPDDETIINITLEKVVNECDIVLISGGSSAGTRDMTARVIENSGEILLHGIAMKPGKPTVLGKIKNKPIFGLPGHPVAAYLVTELFVKQAVFQLLGTKPETRTTKAKLTESCSSNHGREEYIPVKLDDSGNACPIKGKSGLITTLTDIDGYIRIPRDCEGIQKGTETDVIYL